MQPVGGKEWIDGLFVLLFVLLAVDHLRPPSSPSLWRPQDREEEEENVAKRREEMDGRRASFSFPFPHPDVPSLGGQ